MTTTVPKLLDHLHTAQEHDTIIGKYWQLVFSKHADYNILHNSIGEFFTFKSQLYVPKNLVPIMSYEYHNACRHFR